MVQFNTFQVDLPKDGEVWFKYEVSPFSLQILPLVKLTMVRLL